MRGIILFTITTVLFFDICSATHGAHYGAGNSHRVIIKTAPPSYMYINPPYDYGGFPPAAATSYRFDVRYNPMRYGASSYASAMPISIGMPQDYGVYSPMSSYSSSYSPAGSSYSSGGYSSANFIDRHIAERQLAERQYQERQLAERHLAAARHIAAARQLAARQHYH